VGLPSLFGTGLGWQGLILIALTLAALGGGVSLGGAWPSIFPTANGLPRVELADARAVWSDARAIARDFPVFGAGLGSFASIQPYYKTRDASSTTAMSSLLQWWAESGAVGLAILGLAVLWALIRLPGAIRRVGSGDRTLAFGMIGAPVCFAGVSVLHWTVELSAVALAASAVAGSCNRWLAGGTDLFVERG
jgi:O-antigen ligase